MSSFYQNLLASVLLSVASFMQKILTDEKSVPLLFLPSDSNELLIETEGPLLD